LLSFELFGQYNNVIEARTAHFDYQLRQVADLNRPHDRASPSTPARISGGAPG